MDSTGSSAVRKAVARQSINGAVLLGEIQGYLSRFVAYPSIHALVAHVLWIAHTHRMDMWDSTPRLAALSPEPGSGKSRLLEVTEPLVPRPLESINASPAYIFRKISDADGSPTILFDEIDTLFGPRARENEEVRGVLNAGHRRGAVAGRCVVRGKTIETEELPAYCAVALAGLGNLPDTILTRSVVFRMRRRSPTEIIEPYRRRIHAPEGNRLRDQLADWMASIDFNDGYPELPQGVEDRAADVWEPLLMVADAAGGDWPQRARLAAVTLVTDAKESTPSLRVRLLSDLRVVFKDEESMFTSDILIALNGMEEAPWGELRGKPLDSRGLANFLKPFGIKSITVRDGTKTAKGYRRSHLVDDWERYLGSPAEDAVTSVTYVTTPATAISEDDVGVQLPDESRISGWDI